MRKKNKAIAGNCDENKDGLYDSVIAEAISVSRFVDLNLNHNLICLLEEQKLPPCGEAGYDPSQKYRMIMHVPIFDVNFIIKRDTKDAVIDETTWPNESPADMQCRTKGNVKGGQHVLVVDARRRYIYAYTPRHVFCEKITICPTRASQGEASFGRFVQACEWVAQAWRQ